MKKALKRLENLDVRWSLSTCPRPVLEKSDFEALIGSLWGHSLTNQKLLKLSKADLDLINVAHLATFASDCTEASQKYYQQGINFAADLQFLVNAVESTVSSLDRFPD